MNREFPLPCLFIAWYSGVLTLPDVGGSSTNMGIFMGLSMQRWKSMAQYSTTIVGMANRVTIHFLGHLLEASVPMMESRNLLDICLEKARRISGSNQLAGFNEQILGFGRIQVMNLSQQRLGFHNTIRIRIVAFNMRCDQLSLNTVDELWAWSTWQLEIIHSCWETYSYLSCSRQPGYFFHVLHWYNPRFLVKMFPSTIKPD